MRHAHSPTRQHQGLVHQPIRGAANGAAHLRAVAAEGSSAATPAILVGLVLVFVVPLATILILLAFGVADLS